MFPDLCFGRFHILRDILDYIRRHIAFNKKINFFFAKICLFRRWIWIIRSQSRSRELPSCFQGIIPFIQFIFVRCVGPDLALDFFVVCLRATKLFAKDRVFSAKLYWLQCVSNFSAQDPPRIPHTGCPWCSRTSRWYLFKRSRNGINVEHRFVDVFLHFTLFKEFIRTDYYLFN